MAQLTEQSQKDILISYLTLRKLLGLLGIHLGLLARTPTGNGIIAVGFANGRKERRRL
jgi:hypothetical protein